jgi:cold shock CspA family protein
MQGTIQTLCLEHGFGFLRDPEGVKVLFHHSALPSPDHVVTLAVGMVVEFEAEPSLEGPRATTIRIVSTPHR